jgi:hypothetical protein
MVQRRDGGVQVFPNLPGVPLVPRALGVALVIEVPEA